MPRTYLTTSFREKEKVKVLGAEFDKQAKAWFVPEGFDLAPFAEWLTSEDASSMRSVSLFSEEATPALPVVAEASSVAVVRTGISLSALMLGVTQAVARAYATGVWTTVEVVRVDARNGNVYMELAERSAGKVLAQAKGTMWASEARRIIPSFEKATGVVLGAGIKLLVRAKPAAHAVYGLSLTIEAIDPDYTLGDLEAKKREIRSRLQRDGIFDQNKKLLTPWDYNSVVVVAPQGAAGLGDFQAESDRLSKHGVCSFIYVHSRFQGEGAAGEIRATMLRALDEFQREHECLPDAVALIRGGGAVNDLAWLNDMGLARSICELEVPVLTGIGHERDSTVLDEVSHMSFDTPSKVIAGIEQLIVKRAREAQASFDGVVQLATRAVQSTTRSVDAMDAAVRAGSLKQVASAKEQASSHMAAVREGAMRVVRSASEITAGRMFAIREGVTQEIGMAKRLVPEMFNEVTSGASRAVVTADAAAAERFGFVMERGRSDALRAGETVAGEMDRIRDGARRTLSDAASRSEAMMREIAGQGPVKTLGRGFAVVRTGDGKTLTSAKAAVGGSRVDIELHDGVVAAQTINKDDE